MHHLIVAWYCHLGSPPLTGVAWRERLVLEADGDRKRIGTVLEVLGNDGCHEFQIGSQGDYQGVSRGARAAGSPPDAGDLNVGDIKTHCRLLRNLNNRIHAREVLAGMVRVGKVAACDTKTSRLPHRILKVHFNVKQTREVEDGK